MLSLTIVRTSPSAAVYIPLGRLNTLHHRGSLSECSETKCIPLRERLRSLVASDRNVWPVSNIGTRLWLLPSAAPRSGWATVASQVELARIAEPEESRCVCATISEAGDYKPVRVRPRYAAQLTNIVQPVAPMRSMPTKWPSL
jgi:hypothetical protein